MYPRSGYFLVNFKMLSPFLWEKNPGGGTGSGVERTQGSCESSRLRRHKGADLGGDGGVQQRLEQTMQNLHLLGLLL